MRPIAIIPLLLTLVAFILSLLCVFAGSKRGYLENAHLLTVNVSMLGHIDLDSSDSNSTSFLGKLGHKIENTIENGVNDIVDELSEKLHIHDFYSAHILDYCEGYYTPSPLNNKTSHPKKNVTRCSNHTTSFQFNPSKTIQDELKSGITLDDLKWPDALRDGIRIAEGVSKIMFVLYCIGIAATGFALIGAITGVITSGRLSALVNMAATGLAFLSLGIASAIVSVIINKVVNAINKHGHDIDIAAYKGNTFLGMTWSAVVLVFLAGIAWTCEFVVGRRHNSSHVKEEHY